MGQLSTRVGGFPAGDGSLVPSPGGPVGVEVLDGVLEGITYSPGLAGPPSPQSPVLLDPDAGPASTTSLPP